MFSSAFRRSIHQISIFHHPSSPPSRTALSLLESAISSPYPTATSKSPLKFNLDVVEAAPTSDQLQIILRYYNHSPKKDLSISPSRIFLSSHPSAPSTQENGNLDTISRLGSDNPNALKWPIVVDWDGGRAAVGDIEEVKSILESIRKLRDGEAQEEKVDQPKGWFS